MAATKKPVKARAMGGLKKPLGPKQAQAKAVAKRKNAVQTGRMSMNEYLGGDRAKKPTRKGAGGKTML